MESSDNNLEQGSHRNQQPLKVDPKYGHFPWWPEDGNDWVHPDDVELARRTIPSPRIWCREGIVPQPDNQGNWVVLHYGKLQLRVERVLWVDLEGEGLEIGDHIEVLPHGMKNDAQLGEIRERHWQPHKSRIAYQITTTDGTLLETWFHAEDLKLVDQPLHEPEFRIEPPEDDGVEIEVDGDS